MIGRRSGRAAALLALAALAACSAKAPRPPSHPELASVAERNDMLALSDALEALVANGRDTPADRQFAYETVRTRDPASAADAFARAAITGRVVQQQGLRAAKKIRDIEEYARRSRDLDPTFRDGAATRLLGTLYVIAPATLLKYGDSETGLDLLEDLTAEHPETPENHLRLAEAYITLHDPDPARPHLCQALARQAALRPDDQQLLNILVAEFSELHCDR